MLQIYFLWFAVALINCERNKSIINPHVHNNNNNNLMIEACSMANERTLMANEVASIIRRD